MKKIAIVLIIFSLLIGQVVFAEMDEKGDYGVRFVSISTIMADIEITKYGKSIINSSVTAYPSEVDYIKMDVDLQQYVEGKWITIKTWTSESDYNFCAVTKQYYVRKGYQYRTVTDVYTYKSGRLIEDDTTIASTSYF